MMEFMAKAKRQTVDLSDEALLAAKALQRAHYQKSLRIVANRAICYVFNLPKPTRDVIFPVADAESERLRAIVEGGLPGDLQKKPTVRRTTKIASE